MNDIRNDIRNSIINDKYSWLVLLSIVLYVLAYSPFIYKIFSRKNVNQNFKKEYYIILVGAFLSTFLYSYRKDNYLSMLYSAIKIIIAISLIVAKIIYP